MAPNKSGVTAGDVAGTSGDLSGTLIFSLGCHSGLPDPGQLDLPQAFAQKRANYLGNTGFGYGGENVVYSEMLVHYFAAEIQRGASAEIGPALTTAKNKYYTYKTGGGAFDAVDAKVLMEMTHYGLSMVEVTTPPPGLADQDPFPSATEEVTPPGAFGDLNGGRISYRLTGAFGEDESPAGVVYTLDGNVEFAAGAPVQPRYFADVGAPAAGALHGAVLLSAVYNDVANVDPVIAAPLNEYVQDVGEPSFQAAGWYPPVPFAAHGTLGQPAGPQGVVMTLGQFNSQTGTGRQFSQMALATFYSNSPDAVPAQIQHVDGVLDPGAGQGNIKVETRDGSGVQRVVVAFTEQSGAGQPGTWQSRDLTFDAPSAKWTGSITATTSTRFFVQVVDHAGNVAIDDNKGSYYAVLPPLPLATGRPVDTTRHLYLPLIER